MKKKLCLRYRIWILLIFIILLNGTNQIVQGSMNSSKYNNKFGLLDKGIISYTNNEESKVALLDNENQNILRNQKEAMVWSRKNFPKIPITFSSDEDINKIKGINNSLRQKYLNRSELYENYEELEKIDNIFTTSATENIVLYANFTAEDFGINTKNFLEDNENTFNTMLQNSEYGIDYGYFLGDLTPRSLDSEKNETIQIKLTVPAGTKLTRVGSINHSQFILERGSTLQYTGKEVLKNNDLRPVVNISAELITKNQLDLETEIYNDAMNDMLENEFKLASRLIKLEPIGLNAGLVLSQGENVAKKSLESLRQENLLETEGVEGWSVFFTNGWLVHTTVFTIETEGMDVEQRREVFNHYFNTDASGTTMKLDGGKARTSINFNQLENNNILTENRLIEHFGSITLHEYFHFLVNKNDSFKNRKMFKETSFEESVIELKNVELDILTDILNDGYAGVEDYEEFISEAFRAKLHPYQAIAERSAKEMLWTNRFLINIFDISPPTIPQNLKELDAKGNSVKFTFDHSSDNISVQKYNVYKNGEFVSSYDTDEDENGFSSPNPGENQENIKVEIDGLEQATEYEFQVSAVDEAKNESEKSLILKIQTKDTEPPELGGNLKGNPLGSTLARFNWPHPTDNVGVSEAKIRRIESSSIFGFNFSPKVETSFRVPGDVNFFTDFTIEKGKTYTYSMTAFDAAGNESERSNNVVIQTSDDDDRKRNEDKAENTSSSSSTLNWSGSFNGVSASGFQIFSWTKGIAGWLFGGVTSVAGTVTSSIVSLTPGMEHQFVVIPVDSEGNPINEGLQISVDSIDRSSIQTKDSELYVGQIWDKADNFVSATDEDGKAVSFDDERILTNEDSVDTTKPGVYELKYSFKGVAKTTDSVFTVTVKEDKSSIQTKDVTIYAGQNWKPEDSFVSATDEDGKTIPFEDARITTNEASVDTTIPGVYELKYSFKGVAKTTDSVFTVTVKEDKSSIQTKDVTIFVGQNWKPEDNFVSATDEDGKAIPFEDARITTNEASVDTTTPGVYKLKYSFKGVVKTTDFMFTVTVKEEESALHFLTYTGFSSFTDGFTRSVHIFNEKTKILDFQDGVDLINPGIHIFTTNRLVGIQSNGAEVVLDEQQASGGSIVFNITYKTQINNYKDYTHFRINVEYYDTLWHNTRKAEASFIIR